MEDLKILNVTIPPGLWVSAVYLFWVVGLLILKNSVFGYIKKIASKSENPLGILLIKSAKFPLTLLIITSGGLIISRVVPESLGAVWMGYLLPVFKGVTIISIIIFFDKVASGAIKIYSGKVELLRISGGIAKALIRVLVICIGVLALLDSFGISITPVLASLGIGSLAVALALQPTLENFFSGIQLITDKPIQIGHFVRLDSGEEGYVHKIGWRSTWIQMGDNNMVVIPNKSLVNAKVINFYYPNPELSVKVSLGVHYDSDLQKVENVILDLARLVMKEFSPGIKNFEPNVRFHTFAESSVDLTVTLWAKENGDCGLLRHEFIKRLRKRFLQEGIVIPYPIRAVNYAQEKANL